MFENLLNQKLQSLCRHFRITQETSARDQTCVRMFESQPGETQEELSRRMKEELRKMFQAKQPLGPSELPEPHLSVSHTTWKDKIWIVGVVSDQHVGVDLEWSQREVHEGVLERVTTFEEREQFEWDVLRFWVVKEAAFKSNPHNHGTVLPQYRVESWDPQLSLGKIALPLPPVGISPHSWECHFTLFELDPWVLALAYSVLVKRTSGC